MGASEAERQAPGGPRRTSAGWIGILVLLLCQYAFFLQFAEREIVWGYPMAYDQTTFLARAYETYDHMLSHGFLSGLVHGLAMRTP